MAAPRPEPAPLRKIGNLRMVWRRMVDYPGILVAAGLSLLVAALATLAIPDGLRRVIDRGFGAQGGGLDLAHTFNYLFMIVAVLAVATACRFYFVSILGQRVVSDVRSDVQDNMLRLEPRFFEENRPSEIASRITADTSVIETVVGSTVSIALRNIVVGVGGTIYLLTLAPKMTLALLVGLPVVVVPIVLLGRRVRNLSRASQDRIADLGSIVAETLGAMKIVQAFGQESRESRRFRDAVETAYETARRRILVRALLTCIVIAMLFGGITLLMRQAAFGVSDGTISGGTVAAFITTGALVAGALGALTEVYGDLLRAAGAAGRLGELLAEEPQIRAPATPVALPEPALGALAFEAVTFRYPTRPEVSALDDFSLTVKPGELLAVVGPSGAGKSTLFNLAQRFYDPSGGAVRMDGVDLREADPAVVAALADDLNTVAAVQALHALAQKAAANPKLLGTFAASAALIGVVPEAVELDDAVVHDIDSRVRARLELLKAKNFAEADKIRDDLVAQGIQLKDGKEPATGERVTTWDIKR